MQNKTCLHYSEAHKVLLEVTIIHNSDVLVMAKFPDLPEALTPDLGSCRTRVIPQSQRQNMQKNARFLECYNSSTRKRHLKPLADQKTWLACQTKYR
jgi:hypothetical protein